jgi:hypothetical protein
MTPLTIADKNINVSTFGYLNEKPNYFVHPQICSPDFIPIPQQFFKYIPKDSHLGFIIMFQVAYHIMPVIFPRQGNSFAECGKV